MAHTTTVCIKTLVRPKPLERLLASTLGHGLPILVADDSPEEEQQESRKVSRGFPGVRFLALPHDVGLSAGRNAMLDEIDTPYFVMMEDDFVLTERSNLRDLVAHVEGGLFDLVGGTVLHHGALSHYEGFIEVRNNTLELTPIKHPVQGPTACDITFNFLAGKTDLIRRVRWDDRLKVCEHQAFFLRCKAAGVRVGYVPHVQIDHKHESPPAYSYYRKARSNEYFALFKELYGFEDVCGSLAA